MRLVIESVTLIDGIADAAREDVDVVVDGDTITGVFAHSGPIAGPTDGLAVRVIDGRGRTLLPGLIDAHAHYTFDPTEGSLQVIAERRDAAILQRAEAHAARALRPGSRPPAGRGRFAASSSCFGTGSPLA